MKPALATTLLAAGGLTLFGGAFVAFAALAGKPLGGLPLLGKAFPPEGEADDGARSESATPEPRSERELARADLGVLGAFLVPSPFSARELEALQADLKATRSTLAQRGATLDARERDLTERERMLLERFTELEGLRATLEGYELELRRREEELERDQAASLEREEQGWRELAAFFEEGDAKKHAARLGAFEPREAARILRALDPKRASELVNALPAERYREFLDAYRSEKR